VSLEDGADDVEERPHADGGDEEGFLTTEGLDTEEDEDGGGDELDDAVDTGRKEGVEVADVTDLDGRYQIGGGRKEMRATVQRQRSEERSTRPSSVHSTAAARTPRKQ
jgi:hypothetical protein